MFIKLEKGKVAKCEISEMPGEEKFDLEIKMLFDQITMNKMVKIKECGSSKENSVLYIDSIFCNKDDLAKIEEHRRYNLKITARELVEETNIRFVYITLNNVDFPTFGLPTTATIGLLINSSLSLSVRITFFIYESLFSCILLFVTACKCIQQIFST